jgi:hypothetical protein
MADFRTITDTISYRSENQFVCSVSDKLDGFLHRARMSLNFQIFGWWLPPVTRSVCARPVRKTPFGTRRITFFCSSLASARLTVSSFKPKKIGDILTPHRQRHSFRKYRKVRQAVAPANEKYRNFFCRSVAEQQQLILCHIKFAGRKFNQ